MYTRWAYLTLTGFLRSLSQMSQLRFPVYQQMYPFHQTIIYCLPHVLQQLAIKMSVDLSIQADSSIQWFLLTISQAIHHVASIFRRRICIHISQNRFVYHHTSLVSHEMLTSDYNHYLYFSLDWSNVFWSSVPDWLLHRIRTGMASTSIGHRQT